MEVIITVGKIESRDIHLASTFQRANDHGLDLRKLNRNWRRYKFGRLVQEFQVLRVEFQSATGPAERASVVRKARTVVRRADKLIHPRSNVICIDRDKATEPLTTTSQFHPEADDSHLGPV